jgi:L-alanine-DL-glutamate epimerase-like enolase superfamily enzyme
MKITKTEVFVLGDPEPAKPSGTRVSELAFVRIHTDEGITGTSEVFAVPAGVVRTVLDGPDSLFGQTLLGEDPIPPLRLRTRLYNNMVHGNRRGWAIICIGAVEVALWDIFGKVMARPVYQLLGGAERSRYRVTDPSQRHEVVPYCSLISALRDPESTIREHVERVEQLKEQGFRGVKLEPMEVPPETIVEVTRRSREILGPDVMLAVDNGYGFSDVPTALRVMEELAEYDVYFFETPFEVDALEAYAELTAKSPVPIAAGEHTVTRWEFLDLMDRGGLQVVQPYMTTCGGLSEVVHVLDLAEPRGVQVIPGNWSTHVLSAATVHLAAFSTITPFFEYVPAQLFTSPLRSAIMEQGFEVVDGAIPYPTAPGIGIEIPDDLIEHFRVG